MVLVARIVQSLVVLGWLDSIVTAQGGRIENHGDGGHDNSSTATVCEARTINYITHTLPQLCFTSTWKSSVQGDADPPTTPTAGWNSDVVTNESAPPTASISEQIPVTSEEPEEDNVELSSGDAAAPPFMSFEDWKEMMLRRTGQDPQDLRSRKANSGRRDDRTPVDMSHFELGGEDEISLDFEDYLDSPRHDRSGTPSSAQDGFGEVLAGEDMVHEGDQASLRRSKDAGKTCKERFSYSSFDAGATILKTGASTKNAKAILVENKDSYMLLECAMESKYVIVELSDDILIDTIVLANFEFFSSMIRHFRVSVSDRYPVKMERWKEIGMFEARNSRDIQPFLVENPQIWAKYVRIEFLTHYGNEYYCPVSLLRIHGSRMLDSWKDSETSPEEEGFEDDEELKTVGSEEEIKTEGVEDKTPTAREYGEKGDLLADKLETIPWSATSVALFSFNMTCASDWSSFLDAQTPSSWSDDQNISRDLAMDRSSAEDEPATQTQTKPYISSANATSASPLVSSSTNSSHDSRPTVAVNSSVITANTATEAATDPSQSTRASNPASVVPKHRSTGSTSASPASATVQEGFFNAVTKRLQNVELNLTLSLQYLEDQSRHIQEALKKTEQKQLSKVTVFLENLNQTVLSDLRSVRDQYDQIWQSTVIALESQKEQYERDIVALSSRLNLLADEVVFQKRMAIVQAVLLLCCLFLVIFSRGVPIPYLAPLLDQGGGAAAYATSDPLHMPSHGLVGTGHDGLIRSAPSRRHQNLQASSQAAPVPGRTAIHLLAEEQESRQPLLHDGAEGVSTVESHDGPQGNDRLSPPLTPNLEEDSRLLELNTSGCDLHSLPRRVPFSHNSGRKPLPALPEHPSPEQ